MSTTTGFHGTSAYTANLLCHGAEFECSTNDGDWLGCGAYFFVDHAGSAHSAAERASRWAIHSHDADPSGPAVIKVQIDDDGQLDLWQDDTHRAIVADQYASLVDAGADLPLQRPGEGWHRRDRYIIDYTCEWLSDNHGFNVRSVRGLLDERPIVFPSSALLTDPHVQIAVRDTTAISDIRIHWTP